MVRGRQVGRPTAQACPELAEGLTTNGYSVFLNPRILVTPAFTITCYIRVDGLTSAHLPLKLCLGLEVVFDYHRSQVKRDGKNNPAQVLLGQETGKFLQRWSLV